MGSIGLPEVLIFLAVIILFFGAKKIPELARGIGQGINEFNQVSDEDTDKKDDTDKKRVEVPEDR